MNNFLINLSKLSQKNKLLNSYLFEVNNYDSDVDDIKTFIKFLFCFEQKNLSIVSSCSCNSCVLINKNNHPDYYEIKPDGNFIKKEQILMLESEFKNSSVFSNKKIYIIKEAEKLNVSAANSLLKFLEEPNLNVYGFLLTKNRYSVLPTILSRCQVFSFDVSEDNNSDVDDYLFFLNNIVNKELIFNYELIFDKFFNENEKLSKEKIVEFLDNFIIFLLNIYKKKIEFDISEDIIIKYINIINYNKSNLKYNLNLKLFLISLFSELIGGEL